MTSSTVRLFAPLSSRRTLALLAVVSLMATLVITIASSRPVHAATTSNFVATGHDMDYHCSGGDADECAYMKILIDKVRNGSTLPILALDEGTQISEAVTAMGGEPSVTTVNPADTTTFNATAFTDSSGVAAVQRDHHGIGQQLRRL